MSDAPHSNNTQDAASAPPFVLAELSERCMGNAAVAALLLGKFEDQLAADIPTIEERLAARDAAQIASTAHALKGAAGAVAAVALRDLAATVETLARQDQLDAIAHELSALRAEAERCLGYLPAARGALSEGNLS